MTVADHNRDREVQKDAAVAERPLHAGDRASDPGPGAVDRQVPEGAPSPGQVRLLQYAAYLLRRHRGARRAVRSVRLHGGVLVRNEVGGNPAGEAGTSGGGHQAVSTGAARRGILR
jgi:hypothetical protein